MTADDHTAHHLSTHLNLNVAKCWLVHRCTWDHFNPAESHTSQTTDNNPNCLTLAKYRVHVGHPLLIVRNWENWEDFEEFWGI